MKYLSSLLLNAVLGLLSLFSITLSDRSIKILSEFIKFSIVGTTNTIVSYLIYSVSLLIFKYFNLIPAYDYLLALTLSFVLSVLWSFYFNMSFVFSGQRKGSIASALIKTYVSYGLTGLLLSGILLSVLVEVFFISDFIAPLVVLVITVPLNFLLNKFWSFK